MHIHAVDTCTAEKVVRTADRIRIPSSGRNPTQMLNGPLLRGVFWRLVFEANSVILAADARQVRGQEGKVFIGAAGTLHVFMARDAVGLG